MQFLDLFDFSDNESAGEGLKPRASAQQVDKGIALVMNKDALDSVRKILARQLREALLEREEEQKMWEQNNLGWDNSSFWGGAKRQGRRSPFRCSLRKTSSGD